MSDESPFQILSPTSIKLSPLARELAREYKMSEVQMARHLLRQHQLRETGQLQRDGEDG